MAQRRRVTRKSSSDEQVRNGAADSHSHSHSHSPFALGHSHGEDGDEHGSDADQIMAALTGAGDRGSQITLVGLFANVGLTISKGVAGWYLHSASLLADAGHSASDLLGDFVTLFCWKLSRKPPSTKYPYGFAKFETVGTATVSLLLIGGALGIGFHSYHLLFTSLNESVTTMPPGPLQTALQNVTEIAPELPPLLVSDHHGELVDPNAAWFAALSILAKEWLYRITKKVADDENSPVLFANAIHHRSDAYSSFVALFAILGSWAFPSIPLDPIGGLLVAIVILTQGAKLLAGAWGDLTDAGISPKTQKSLLRKLQPLIDSDSPRGVSRFSDLRGRRAGSLLFIDLTAECSGSLTLDATAELEAEIGQTLKEARKEISEVRVRFHPTQLAGANPSI